MAAAQGLQELMRLNGCDEGNLPSVDSLRQAVGALSPIMEDSGFHSVLQTIYCASTAKLGLLLDVVDFETISKSLVEDMGTPRDWTEAVHQLVFTAGRTESIYLHANTRSAWLAAFATKVLEMDCTVVYHSHELWQAAGRNGKVTVQVGFDTPDPVAASFTRTFKLAPEDDLGSVVKYLDYTYGLRDALESELMLLRGLSDESKRHVKYTIVRLFTFLSTRKCFTDQHGSPNSEAVKITGSFPGTDRNIVYICRHLGLDLYDLEEEVKLTLRSASAGFLLQKCRGSEWELLPEDTIDELEQLCYCSEHEESQSVGGYGFPCLLRTISDIISGFATTALALLPCLIHHPSIRVCAAAINGQRESKWLEAAVASLTDPNARITLPLLLDHLRSLFFSDDVPPLSKYTVAVSSRATTVAARTLLDEDAYSDSGQYLGIYSGRLNCEGCFRETIEESGPRLRASMGTKLLQPATVAPGIHFVPPNAEFFSRWRIDCNMKTTTRSFEIKLRLVLTATEYFRRIQSTPKEERLRGPEVQFSCAIHDSIYELLTAAVGAPCSHDANSAIVIPRNDTGFASIETGIICVRPSKSSCAMVSAHGNKSRTLFSLFAIQSEVMAPIDCHTACCLVLQGKSCLQCAFRLAKQKFQRDIRYESAAILCTGVASTERLDELL
jgi:hypothetical protein